MARISRFRESKEVLTVPISRITRLFEKFDKQHPDTVKRPIESKKRRSFDSE